MAGFKGLVYDRWQALRQTVLSEEAFCGRLDAYARMFEESGAWERECAKWNGNPVPLKRNISEELDYVKDWYHRNAEELANHIFLGVESGVKEMKISAPLRPSHSVVYNLSGQRVSSYYKGLVIVDGHKMVRR